MIAVAQSDGEVSDEERVTLFRIADILELDGRFVSHSLSKVK